MAPDYEETKTIQFSRCKVTANFTSRQYQKISKSSVSTEPCDTEYKVYASEKAILCTCFTNFYLKKFDIGLKML